ncbi:GH39 family glycosyl hydrolase [Herbidospora daliensis]|uniref:GH39 family glycosyl hydrolase n=1 Tax=Herbidospora daliensis TaxID=295585 RepID=UPI0012FC7B9F|nr:xylan 1,4-beta-xylosidase [Herbidospora daliensis]
MARENRRHWRHARRSLRTRLVMLFATVTVAGAIGALILAMSGPPAVPWQPLGDQGNPPPEAVAGPAQARPIVVGGGAPAGFPVWGFSHTRFSVDSGPPDVTAVAEKSLARGRIIQNQHIMGFGTLNPEPSPGKYDWKSMDGRMAAIERSGGLPVITLCCAPDWMVGGKPGETDWENNFTQSPLRKHYKDFANLAAAAAKRYPQVRHFIVWNEFKGFFNEGLKRWDYEGYTEMYNLVYDALKKVNPKIQVGGPYINVTDRPGWKSEVSGPWGSQDQRGLDAIRFWLKNKHGADFLVVDGTSESSKGMYPDEFAALAKFSAVNAWLRKQSSLPVWWAEWYFEPAESDWTTGRRLAVQAAAMIEFARSGTAAALYWSPQGEGPECDGCLWTNLDQPKAGRPLPALTMLQDFAKWFPAGTRLAAVRSAHPSIRLLASAKKMVVVNTRGEETTATVDGKRLTLKSYEVRWVSR